MRPVLSIACAIAMLFFVLCGVVQDSPLDENGPNFIKPEIHYSINSLNDTIYCDSAILYLIGNRQQGRFQRFQIKVDTLSWSHWQPSGAFPLRSLSDEKHVVYIHTKYENGEKIFTDSVVFLIISKGQKPFFPPPDYDTVIIVDREAQ